MTSKHISRNISHILSFDETSLNFFNAVETLIKDSLFPHFEQFIRIAGKQLLANSQGSRCDLGSCTSARVLSFSLHPKLTCTLFSRAQSRHSRQRAFVVTRNVPKRRANETVRNWFNEVGRSRWCARDEQYEFLKRGRTNERGRKRRWQRQKSRRRKRRKETTAERQNRTEHVKGDLKGKRRR